MIRSSLNTSYGKIIRFCFLLIIDLAVFIVVVEGIRIWKKPFEGFVHLQSPQVWRYVFFGLGLIQIFFIRVLANVPLKKEKVTDLPSALRQLEMSGLLIIGLCEFTAVLGLTIFLLAGLRGDFYIFILLSFFYLRIFYPRVREWEEWINKTVPSSEARVPRN